MEILRKDFIRFSTLHSWYKHIRVKGRDFYVYQDIGEQERNHIDTRVKDLSGIHWHFSDTPPNNKVFSKVVFGPFLGGIVEASEGKKSIFTFHIILSCNEDTFMPWIADKYPEWSSISFKEWEGKRRRFDTDPILLELFENEINKYWLNLVEAVRNII